MTFLNEIIREYNLKNLATSIIKNNQVLSSIRMDNVDIVLRDGPFSSDVGIVNSLELKWTHWAAYINDFFSIQMDALLQKNFPTLL